MAGQRYGLNDPQRFPAPEASGLPVDVLTVQYSLNLLPHAFFHAAFLEMMIRCVGDVPIKKAIMEAVQPFASKTSMQCFKNADNAYDLAHEMNQFLGRKNHSFQVDQALRQFLRAPLEEHIASSPGMEAYQARISHLKKVMDLSREDIALMELAAVYQSTGSFESYCDTFPFSDWAVLISAALKTSLPATRQRMASNSRLSGQGLVSIKAKSMSVASAVFEYLIGISEEVFSCEDFSPVPASEFPLGSFPVNEKERSLLLDSFRSPSPCHIFFYGRPGTGKTELAKALASEAGRQAFLVRYGDDGGERDRRGAITATMGIAPTNSVVIIDEADRLLNTATFFQPKLVDKSWINNFMDECRHKVIWIANESGCIETSVLRRFSYSLEFKKFTAAQRESAWNMQLKRHPLKKVILPAMVSRLAREYETDAGGIASALKATTNIFEGRMPSASEAEETLGQLLTHHEKLSGVERKKKKLNRISPNYDVNALHTDVSAAELVSFLKVRQQKIENGHRPFSVNILFWGLPGTGKTEFAKYIAQELGKELLIKRMSDLQSMWVGETEKQIAAAFEEAEREGAVLFLDEVDSLILDRKTASRSWESSQTNEVLTQIENFSGVCICCTNLLDNLDEAALRRFTWKVKFLPLTPDGAETLFRKYFQPKGRISNAVKAELHSTRDLTPGDFKTVSQRQQYREHKPSPLETVQALKQEVSYKRARTFTIGFSA